MTSLPESLPHDLDAERALLGATLLDPETVWRTLDSVHPAELYGDGHAEILAAARDIALNGSSPADLVAMTAALRDRRELKRCGGATYLSDLVNTLPDVANVEHYCGIVRELARRRHLIRAAQRTLTTATVGGVDSGEIVRQLLGDLAELEGRRSRSTEQTWLADAIAEEAQRALRINREGVGAVGLLTGLDPLDELLGGLKNGEMYLAAARPAVGKSTLADQIAVSAAEQTGRPTFVLVTEMSLAQRARRQLAAAVGVPLMRLNAGRLTPTERDALERLEATRARVRLINAAGRTAAEVRNLVLRAAAQFGDPALVVVDFIQQLRDANPRAPMVERTGEKSRQLRELAAAESVPLVALSQLSRACEIEKREPKLSDLRESGDLEQDAYAVLLLHRVDPGRPERVVCRVAKHRDGPVGVVGLELNVDRMRFRAMGGRW